MADSTHSRMTREEIAEEEVGKTSVSRGLALVLVGTFLATIGSIPLIQQIVEVRAGFASEGRWVAPAAWDLVHFPAKAARAFEAPDKEGFWQRFQAANLSFMEDTKAYEKYLEDGSFLSRSTLPPMQALTAEHLGLGNEQVYIGREGWLFYQPEVAYLTGEGFLEPDVLRRRSRAGHVGETTIQPDPVKAIVDFDRQLRERGIHLILFPVPVKPMLEPEHLSPRFSEPLPVPLQNPSYEAFLRALENSGVDYLDVTSFLWDQKQETGRSQFLLTDTHWTPEAMERSARLLAEKVRARDPGLTGVIAYSRKEESVDGTGDIAAMLKLPADSNLYPEQTVTIFPVYDVLGKPWAADPSSAVLFLGDSFSNLYSLEPMGWGGAAGFAEQFSHFLGAPVDAIRRNDAGAHATREILVKELAQGRDRLAGKRVLVWEFAMRELAVGDWKILPLPNTQAKTPPPSESGSFLTPVDGAPPLRVTGTVESLSPFPQPGEVPYRDHIFTVTLTGLAGPGVPAEARALVYLWSMKGNFLTPASTWKAGDRVALDLKSWNDIAPELERFNRSEPEDPDLLLESPFWGDPAGPP